jgi:hypothetical protein
MRVLANISLIYEWIRVFLFFLYLKDRGGQLKFF